MNLTPSDLAMFEKIRVGPELLTKAGVVRVTDQEARNDYGIRGSGDMAGILFPYWEPSTMANGRRRWYLRIRRDRPEIDNGKPRKKYVTPYGDRKHAFFPPEPSLFADASIPIVWVEAEKSVLAITAFAKRMGIKILPLALGGCYGWMGKTGIKESAKGERVPETGPIPDTNISRDGRKAIVMMDAGCERNPIVRSAKKRLIAQLQKQKAEVYVIDTPAIQEINGPDDFIGALGDDAFLQLLDAAVPAPIAPEPFSEDGLALEFAERHQENWRYVFMWSRWLQYSGAWNHDTLLKVFDLSRKITREAAARCTDEQSSTAKWLRSSATVASVLRLTQSDARIAAVPEQFDSHPWLFNCPGGTVELQSGSLREHRSTDYITKTAETTPKIIDCPLWNSFLEKITGGDVELQRYLQRVAGYALTGATREHALFFLYGTGANGKSTFTNTLLRIWGNYGQMAAMETFTENQNERHPTELAALRGARLVVASEIERGKYWAESRIKTLTGGDTIRARFMHADEFEYIPQFKLMIQGNHKPGLRSLDPAARRRLQLVPFTVTIPEGERDMDLPEKLKAEWSGILQWAINGCIAWQREGLNPPEAVLKATEEYFQTEDALLSWMDERCIVSPQARSTKTSALYTDFKMWAERTGERCGSQREFSQKLQEHGFVIRRSMGKVADGIALRDEEKHEEKRN